MCVLEKTVLLNAKKVVAIIMMEAFIVAKELMLLL